MKSSSRLASAALLLGALHAFAGAEGETEVPRPNAPVSESERASLKRLFEGLCNAFLVGDHNGIKALFHPEGEEDAQRVDLLGESLKREFKAATYRSFEILEIEPVSRDASGRVQLWVRIQYERAGEAGRPAPLVAHNDFFTVKPAGEGFALVGSPFFDVLGQQQGMNVVADGLLLLIVVLACFSFWVWMGFESFRRRPRSHAWRLTVVLVPLLGALLYFFAAYLPHALRGGEEVA